MMRKTGRKSLLKEKYLEGGKKTKNSLEFDL